MIPSFDLAVIGGGSAGYAAARTAQGLGLKVAVIEGGKRVGGLCILRGCMPTKTFLESAHRNHEVARASEFGIRVGKPKPDWKAILKRKDRLIREFADYRKEQLEKGNFTFYRACAKFSGPHRLVLESAWKEKVPAEIEAKTFVVATGSRTAKREIPGLEKTGYWTSDDCLRVSEPVKSLIVLGGRAVGLEFAQYYAHLGVKVSVIQRSSRLLPESDPEVGQVMEKVFRQDGTDVFCGTEILEVMQKGKKKRVEFLQGGKKKTVEAEQILQALGREPDLAGLDCRKAGLEITKGKIAVSDTQQSGVPHIFAAGDVCGPYEVVHLAIQQGEVAAQNAAQLLKSGDLREKMDYRMKLEVIFTSPEAAGVGYSERECRDKGWDIVTASYPFADHGKSMVMGELHGFVKLIALKERGEIVGAEVVGPHASDLIHEPMAVMRYRGTAQEMAEMPHYHPTLSEIWTYPAEEIAGKLLV
ncbi:MAG: NAD(P)/FAD-dependent oxidoreductase [Verrucomicrobia bacterium]|nr:NAD(P)/FAD-dependent oxidoreductase [Verrucomicrobiota bacterium]